MNRKIFRFIVLASLVITAWILGRISGIHVAQQENATTRPVRKSDAVRDSLGLLDPLQEHNSNGQNRQVRLENKE